MAAVTDRPSGSMAMAAGCAFVYCVLLMDTAIATKLNRHTPSVTPPPPLPAATLAPGCDCSVINITDRDRANLQATLNLEYLEADFFLTASFGFGLDHFDPGASQGGPTPIGVQKANLDPYINDLFMQMGYQEIGHIRAIKDLIGMNFSIPRPLIDLSKKAFAEVMNNAVGKKLDPPFDPFANSLNYLLATYVIPYSGLTTYTHASQILVGSAAKLLNAKLLAVEAGQDAIIRNELYRRKDDKVSPYWFTTANMTAWISALRNRDAGEVVDEGIEVPEALGADGRITGNVLASDRYSTAFTATPAQFFAFMYQTGDPARVGGFYPRGGSGLVALALLSAGPGT